MHFDHILCAARMSASSSGQVSSDVEAQTLMEPPTTCKRRWCLRFSIFVPSSVQRTKQFSILYAHRGNDQTADRDVFGRRASKDLLPWHHAMNQDDEHRWARYPTEMWSRAEAASELHRRFNRALGIFPGSSTRLATTSPLRPFISTLLVTRYNFLKQS